ncbi:MAG: amino acid racemase, partial [Xanthomonadales bacterium]|nr:amino acid racemase [Xanthomonadales bacterium]
AGKIIAMTRTGCDQEHLSFVLFSMPGDISDRSAYLRGDAVKNPGYAIAGQLEKMSELGVTSAVIACNTAHASPIFDTALGVLKDKGIKLQLLHLVNETVEHIRHVLPAIQKIGVLGTQGTYRSGLYGEALAAAGLQAVLPSHAIREEVVHAAIYAPAYGIKTSGGVVTEKARELAHSAVRHVREQGAQAIILACTELPLAIAEEQFEGIPIIDPARIAARKLVKLYYPDRLAE